MLVSERMESPETPTGPVHQYADPHVLDLGDNSVGASATTSDKPVEVSFPLVFFLLVISIAECNHLRIPLSRAMLTSLL